MKMKEGAIRWFELGYVVALLLLLAVGWRWMNRGRVGVVDVAHVAVELGLQDVLEEETDAIRRQAQQQVERLRQEWEAEQRTMREAYEATDDEADRQALREQMMRRQARMEMNMAALRQGLQQQQRGLVTGFRDTIAPAVRNAARDARVELVLESGPSVLYRRDRNDLTQAVIQHGRKLNLGAPTPGLSLPELP